MATHIGNAGVVKSGANVIASVVSFTLTENTNVADNTAQGDADQTHLGGTKSFSGSINCYWDETDSTGQESLTNGASVTLHLQPDGNTTGDIDFNGTATITSIERNSANDAIVTANFTFQGSGALTRSVLV